jgi:hypothetical protein
MLSKVQQSVVETASDDLRSHFFWAKGIMAADHKKDPDQAREALSDPFFCASVDFWRGVVEGSITFSPHGRNSDVPRYLLWGCKPWLEGIYQWATSVDPVWDFDRSAWKQIQEDTYGGHMTQRGARAVRFIEIFWPKGRPVVSRPTTLAKAAITYGWVPKVGNKGPLPFRYEGPFTQVIDNTLLRRRLQ